MSRVIHTGQALVDYVLEIPKLPHRGGNVFAAAARRSAGGAVNILVAAARNGVAAVHAGAHGTGENGELIRATLSAEGVSLVNDAEPDLDSGICVCLLEPHERTFVTTLGAERRISVASLDRAAPERGDLVCVDGYTLVEPGTAAPMLQWLSRLPHDVQVVLDPGADFATQPADVRTRALAATAVWTSNVQEAVDLLAAHGAPRGTERTMAAVARAMAGLLRPDAVVVVRDGPAGCAVHQDGRTQTVPGYPQQPVDTNGAGDAHTGILLAGRLSGCSWPQAAARANAGAAIKVTRQGPATAPTAAELDAWLAAREPRLDAR